MQTKYERLLEAMQELKTGQGTDLDEYLLALEKRIKKSHKSADTKYFQLLIELEYLASGFTRDRKKWIHVYEPFSKQCQIILNNEDINHRQDHIFAYILYRTEFFRLMRQDQVETKLSFRAYGVNTLGKLIKMTVENITENVRTIDHKIKRDIEKRNVLAEISACMYSIRDPNFDPFNNPFTHKNVTGKFHPESDKCFYRAKAFYDPEYINYFDNLNRFNIKEFKDKTPKNMLKSLEDLTNAANDLYLNSDSKKSGLENCKELLDQIFQYVYEAQQIHAMQLENPNLSVDHSKINKLVNRAGKIKIRIDSLDKTVPHDSLHWSKILKVALGTLLIGLLWIIPSLLVSGKDSSFRHNPVVSKAQELYEDINTLNEKIQRKAAVPSEQKNISRGP